MQHCVQQQCRIEQPSQLKRMCANFGFPVLRAARKQLEHKSFCVAHTLIYTSSRCQLSDSLDRVLVEFSRSPVNVVFETCPATGLRGGSSVPKCASCLTNPATGGFVRCEHCWQRLC